MNENKFRIRLVPSDSRGWIRAVILVIVPILVIVGCINYLMSMPDRKNFHCPL